jgi:hypothetical protein
MGKLAKKSRLCSMALGILGILGLIRVAVGVTEKLQERDRSETRWEKVRGRLD